ncbi:hypothetical protein D3C85_1611940 [compost metagenome]
MDQLIDVRQRQARLLHHLTHASEDGPFRQLVVGQDLGRMQHAVHVQRDIGEGPAYVHADPA